MKPRSVRSREALLKLMATPVRRKYFETLRRMLGPAGLVSIREEQFFLVLAIAIGILAGFCVVLFRVAIATARLWLLGSSMRPGVPRVVLVPALVGLVIAVLAVRFFPRVRGSGVNQTKGALYIYDGYISTETVLGKFVLSALAIGSGQSLGPEDPALQIGAGVASALGRWLKLSKERLRLVAPVGAAAGLAAAFNAPITAVLFVIEEVIGRWSAGILGAVVLSAISSVVVERWFMGDESLFRVPQYHLDHAGELIAYAVLGVVGGVASLVFVKAIKHLRPRLRRLPQWSQYLQPGVAGLLIGFIAIWYPQVMGAGYEWIDLGDAQPLSLGGTGNHRGTKVALHRLELHYGNSRADCLHRYCSLAQCWAARWPCWSNSCFRRSRFRWEPMRWWEWGRCLPEFCARP